MVIPFSLVMSQYRILAATVIIVVHVSNELYMEYLNSYSKLSLCWCADWCFWRANKVQTGLIVITIIGTICACLRTLCYTVFHI